MKADEVASGLLIAFEDIVSLDGYLSHAGLGVFVQQPKLYSLDYRTGGSEPYHVGGSGGDEGRGLGEAVAYGVGEMGFEQKTLNFGVKSCPAYAEEPDAAAEFLEELLPGLAVHHLPERGDAVHETQQRCRGEFGQDGAAVYLFYNKGYGQYSGGTHLREGVHQD